MTHTLAMEWAKHNIRVSSVSPGLVQTAMTYWVPQQPDWEQQLRYYGGFPRLAEVQELGGAYVYLLSDAASYTTSIDIPVNGVIGSKFFFLFVRFFLVLVGVVRLTGFYSLLGFMYALVHISMLVIRDPVQCNQVIVQSMEWIFSNNSDKGQKSKETFRDIKITRTALLHI